MTSNTISLFTIFFYYRNLFLSFVSAVDLQFIPFSQILQKSARMMNWQTVRKLLFTTSSPPEGRSTSFKNEDGRPVSCSP